MLKLSEMTLVREMTQELSAKFRDSKSNGAIKQTSFNNKIVGTKNYFQLRFIGKDGADYVIRTVVNLIDDSLISCDLYKVK